MELITFFNIFICIIPENGWWPFLRITALNMSTWTFLLITSLSLLTNIVDFFNLHKTGEIFSFSNGYKHVSVHTSVHSEQSFHDSKKIWNKYCSCYVFNEMGIFKEIITDLSKEKGYV
jgi:hypothetical protein